MVEWLPGVVMSRSRELVTLSRVADDTTESTSTSISTRIDVWLVIFFIWLSFSSGSGIGGSSSRIKLMGSRLSSSSIELERRERETRLHSGWVQHSVLSVRLTVTFTELSTQFAWQPFTTMFLLTSWRIAETIFFKNFVVSLGVCDK